LEALSIGLRVASGKQSRYLFQDFAFFSDTGAWKTSKA
jgi:hypothetical protein